MKHTPGPWRVSNQDFTTGQTNGFDVMHGDPDGSELLCVAADLRSLQDANLIAAAPDLLAALKALDADVAGKYGTNACVDALIAARAAIAKAEGKS